MNTFKLAAHTEDSIAFLTIIIDDEGLIKQEVKYMSDDLIEVPNIITDLFTLSLWEETDKTIEDFKELFLYQYRGMYLKPVRINDMEGNGYYIHTNKAGVIVNYKRGKFKEFTNLYQALDWICNLHYPAQQRKIIDEVIL